MSEMTPTKFLAINDLNVARRRRAVMDLLNQGIGYKLSLREMSELLARPRGDGPGIVNHNTGEPWSTNTLMRDIRWIEEEWRRDSIRDLGEHKSEMLSNLRHLYQTAVRAGDLSTSRAILKDIRDLLGLDSPQIIAFEQVERAMDDALTRIEQEFGNDPETLHRILSTLMGAEDTGAISRAQAN